MDEPRVTAGTPVAGARPRPRRLRRDKGGGHNDGINIAAPRGAPVRAVDAGTVAYAGNEIRGYGNLVLVKHPSGYYHRLCAFDALLVKRGDTVSRGQVIAKVGDDRRGQRAAAAFRAAPRQEGGRSARVPGSGVEGRRRERSRRLDAAEPEWPPATNRLHWEDRVAIHLGPRGYDLDRLRAGQDSAQYHRG